MNPREIVYKRIDKRSRSSNETWKRQHRFEHWLIDNQVYFITSTCRDHTRAMKSEEAKHVFWNRFDHYTREYGFTPWVTSILDTHYHTLGYLKIGDSLSRMMQRLHGSTSKLINDTLEVRLVPFWRTEAGKEYFDGCIRNEKQARRAYRYTLLQSVRHGIVRDYREYSHTRVDVELERAIRRAHELDAFLEHVPYKRYGEH